MVWYKRKIRIYADIVILLVNAIQTNSENNNNNNLMG